jgi:phasin family protein
MNHAIVTPDQVLNAVKTSNAMFAQVAATSFDAIEKQIDLNLKAMRSSLADVAEASNQMLGVKDFQEFYAAAQHNTQPLAVKATSYARKAYAINAETATEFARLAEHQVAEANKSVAAMINEMNKTAPSGTEGVVALVKSAFSASNTAYEAVNKATKQVVDMVEANVEAVAKAGESVVNGAAKAPSRKRGSAE